MILVKSLFRSMDQMLHPHKIKTVQFEGYPVDSSTRHGVSVYVCAYLCLVVLSTLVVSAEGFDFDTSLSSVIACVNNIGPGIGAVGPMGNYSIFNGFTKLFLSFCMLLGRLEIFPIMMLFSPLVWRKNS